MLPDPGVIEPIAELVRARREQLGLSQNDVAEALCLLDRPTVTGNDIARYEKAKRIPRAPARRALEQALDLPIFILDRAAAEQRAARSPSNPTIGISPGGPTNDPVAQIRAAFLDSSAGAIGDDEPPSLESLNQDLDQAMAHYQAALFDRMLTRLPSLVTGAHRATACSRGHNIRRAKQTVALSAQAAAMVLTKLGEHDLAWIASERGLAAANESDDQAVIASLQRSMVHTLQSHGRNEASSKLAERTADQLRANLPSGTDREVSVYGTLLLAASMTAARAGDSSTVREYLDEAGHYADQLGRDANHLWTTFGPTNVAVHRVATAVAQDDIAQAEQHSESIHPAALPSERRIRYLFDLAMIDVRRDRPEAAITIMLEAERHGPEQVHNHVMGQQIVAHLRNSQAGRQDPRLAQLDRRTRRTKATTGQK